MARQGTLHFWSLACYCCFSKTAESPRLKYRGDSAVAVQRLIRTVPFIVSVLLPHLRKQDTYSLVYTSYMIDLYSVSFYKPEECAATGTTI
jgi:hypothetical protein